MIRKILFSILALIILGGAAFQFRGLREDIVTVITSSSTRTLTNTSTQVQRFTGSTVQDVFLPSATALQSGMSYLLINESSTRLNVYNHNSELVTQITGGSQGSPNSKRLYLTSSSTTGGPWTIEQGSGGSGSGSSGDITEWTEFSGGSVTVPCSVGAESDIFYRQVGDTLYVRGSFRCTTTVSAITAWIDFTTFTIDYTKLTTYGDPQVGTFQAQTGGTQTINTSSQGGHLYADGSDTNTIFFAYQVSSNNYVALTNMTTILGTNEVMQFEFSVPIQ
jgi:hypothetical protein